MICVCVCVFINLSVYLYSYNKGQRDALFLKFMFDKELYMFRTDLTVHRQESHHCTHSNRYLSY